MPSKPSDSNPSPRAGGLWARLRGAAPAASSSEKADDDVLPTWDVPEAQPVKTSGSQADVPVATPLGDSPPQAELVPEAVPVCSPFEVDEDVPTATPLYPGEAMPVASPVTGAEPVGEAVPAEETPAAAPPQYCQICQAERVGDAAYCMDCGFMFPEKPAVQAAAPVRQEPAGKRLADRYEMLELLRTRGDIRRYRGVDHGGSAGPAPVVIVEMPFTATADAAAEQESSAESGEMLGATATSAEGPETTSFSEPLAGLSRTWPSLGWEWDLLRKIDHPSLPRLLDYCVTDDRVYLIEDAPAGRILWDAWDDPEANFVLRFNWLAELAEGLKVLHDNGAILEGLRPEIVTITDAGHACINDLSDLLPLPLPAEPAIQGLLYSAPELVYGSDTVDARADLYGFGAMLYALYVGRELTEMDFERQGVPKHFVMQFPDVHPALARVMMKTFVREKERRFPSDEAVKTDPTGFAELARTLRTLGHLMSRARLDVASWTTTGIARTGNEDAFALLHGVGSKQDDMGERLLVILADGMGGYEAGEVASAMAIDSLRQQVLKHSQFAGLAGDAAAQDAAPDPGALEQLFAGFLRETNKQIFAASRTPGVGKRGMGCTAELVYVDGRQATIGHVGDSRTYHYTGGRLVQLTRDQTLVNRLVELGHLTLEEAESHPRKNELQQAIGGQPMVDPQTCHALLKPGDWILVCSDGLTNHVSHETLTEMIQRADSAEMCARRMVNLANLQGGSDNCTVIAIRVT